jgi:hypothetical protein
MALEALCHAAGSVLPLWRTYWQAAGETPIGVEGSWGVSLAIAEGLFVPIRGQVLGQPVLQQAARAPLFGVWQDRQPVMRYYQPPQRLCQRRAAHAFEGRRVERARTIAMQSIEPGRRVAPFRGSETGQPSHIIVVAYEGLQQA